MNAICDHKWIYGGIKYEIESYPLPGTGAHSVAYFDWFFCEKDPEHSRYVALGHHSDTYEKIKFNATPKRS